MEVKGKPTINPWLFYLGKAAGYLTWLILYLSVFHFRQLALFHSMPTKIIAVALFAAGIVFTTLSLAFLGRSVRLGLPAQKTMLKTGGIYQISRNPMYIGLHLLTLASMVYTLHPLVIIMGIFSFVVYHLIILGEEKFLKERFGEPYLSYMHKVRRYL